MPARKRKYNGGSGVKPKGAARGVNGSIMPIQTIDIVVIVRGRLGRLRKGLPTVRMIKSTRVCVARDSTNQPV
jgi:hypothetical protein